MNIITIPKSIAAAGDLIIIPRKRYEELTLMKKYAECVPTSAQKRAFVVARQNFHKGKTLSYNELVKKLGFAD